MSTQNPNDTLDLPRWQRLKQLVADAMELPEAARSTFVDTACAGDAALKAELESLLAAAAASDTPLDASPAGALMQALAGRSTHDLAGHRLGAYQLQSLIARGGMGDVYRAERADGQYEQQVAVKVAVSYTHLTLPTIYSV